MLCPPRIHLSRPITTAVVIACLGVSLSLGTARGQVPAPASETVYVNELRTVRAVLPDTGGGFALVGTLKTASAPSRDGGAGIVLFDAGLKAQAPAAVPGPAAASAIQTTPEAAIRLADGDIVVVGSVDSRAGATRLGWAARVSRDGAPRWSRTWEGAPDGMRAATTPSTPASGAPAATTSNDAQEYFYFAREIAGGQVLIGGKYQQGRDNCQNAAVGVVLRIDARTGDSVGPKRLVEGGGKRQGLRDAIVERDGTLLLSGWINDGAANGATCFDDVWLVRYDLKTGAAKSSRMKMGGQAVALAAGALEGGGAVLAGYGPSAPLMQSASAVPAAPAAPVIAAPQAKTPDSTGAAQGGAVKIPAPLEQALLARVGSEPVPKPDFVQTLNTAATSRISFLTGGFDGSLTAGGAQTPVRGGRTEAWLRLIGASGSCAGDFSVASTDARFEDLRAFAGTSLPAAGGNTSAIIVAGDARGGKAPAPIQETAFVHVLRVHTGERAQPWPLGALPRVAQPLIVGRTSSGSTVSYEFAIATKQILQLAARSLDTSNPVTLLLRTSVQPGAGPVNGGQVIDMATNPGAAVIESMLEPGTYRLDIASSKPQALVTLAVSSGDAAATGDAAAALLNDLPPDERRLIIKELEMLGYSTGPEALIGAGASAVRAIQAFQAANCLPITGRLSDAQKRHLAIAAASAETRKAEAAIAAWRAIKALKIFTETAILVDGTPLVIRYAMAGGAGVKIKSQKLLGEIVLQGFTIYEGELTQTAKVRNFASANEELSRQELGALMNGHGRYANFRPLAGTVTGGFRNEISNDAGTWRPHSGGSFTGEMGFVRSTNTTEVRRVLGLDIPGDLNLAVTPAPSPQPVNCNRSEQMKALGLVWSCELPPDNKQAPAKPAAVEPDDPSDDPDLDMPPQKR